MRKFHLDPLELSSLQRDVESLANTGTSSVHMHSELLLNNAYRSQLTRWERLHGPVSLHQKDQRAET